MATRWNIVGAVMKYSSKLHNCKSYVYWTVHHCDSWRIRNQLDITCYYVLFHFFYAQHVSDINTSIIRSLRLFYFITTLVVCSCFDVCWSFVVAGLGWYPCSRLKQASACYTDTTTTQPHRNSNTHRNKDTRPMWWFNRKVADSWWWMY